MLRFTVLVAHCLVLMAPVTLHTTLEIVVLALAANPTAIGELKIFLLSIPTGAITADV